jgi:hypothetical protein
MEGRSRSKRKRLAQFRRMTKCCVNRSESGKFGAVFYHPAQNVNLVLLKLNGTAISRNEHRIIGTIKTIRKKN